MVMVSPTVRMVVVVVDCCAICGKPLVKKGGHYEYTSTGGFCVDTSCRNIVVAAVCRMIKKLRKSKDG